MSIVLAAGLVPLLAALPEVAGVDDASPAASIAAAVSSTSAASAASAAAAAAAAAARGERLFDGREPLAGKLAGHTAGLPSGLGACMACHGSAASSSALEARAAPPLGCTTLARIRERRGEPPFAYDRDSFCRTLRTGINPNEVVLQRTMPRFALEQGQCDALWAYLTTKGAGCHDKR
jgi:cytochrome c553